MESLSTTNTEEFLVLHGEPVEPLEEGAPDINQYWETLKKEARALHKGPRGKLERFLEVELFALPPGGTYVITYQKWLEVSNNIPNPFTFIKARYGNAILCTRNVKGEVAFMKRPDEEMFLDYNDIEIGDAFNAYYKGTMVPVEIGDFWYRVCDVLIRKYEIISYNPETKRYLFKEHGPLNKFVDSMEVKEEGFLPYGESIAGANRGMPCYPYSRYIDRMWFAQQYRRALLFKQSAAYRIFRHFEVIKNPDLLEKLYQATEEWITTMQALKKEFREKRLSVHKENQEKKLEKRKRREGKKFLK